MSAPATAATGDRQASVATASEVLDCATKLRIHYRPCRPVGRDLAELFPQLDLVVNEFSRHVAGASDHFTLSDGERLHVSGILGQPILAVTFWNRDVEARRREVAGFEQVLHAGGYGLVLRRTTADSAPGSS